MLLQAFCYALKFLVSQLLIVAFPFLKRPQFNMIAGGLDAAGLSGFDGRLDALNNLVADTFLVPQLRDQYGVYTPIASASEEYFMLYAYRDPNVAETFQVLAQLPEQIAGMALDQDTLNGYIMNAYSSYAMPLGELTGAASAAMDTLQGLDPARRLNWMRQLKQLTPWRCMPTPGCMGSCWKTARE